MPASTETDHAGPGRAPVRPVDLGLNAEARTAAADDPPAVHVRAKIDEQLRALLEHEAVARVGEDPEGVHQMRVAVRRIRAALKADGAGLGPAATELQTELRWLGSMLGAVRDIDVQLEHLRGQAAEFEPDERAAVERLLLGLRADRRRARQRMLGALRSRRYTALLEGLAAAARTPAPLDGNVVVGKPAIASLLELIKRPYRKLSRAAAALGADPADDDLHALRIYSKRLRYAAELAAPAGGKPVRRLIRATRQMQDVLGDHQDAVVAEQQVRRLLAELGDVLDADVAFAAGRLVERERARRADCRSRWRTTVAEVDARAMELLAG
ncbi:MAG TPA: CHAD domain-containing protein [Actinophytocola sp.]|uniref:CHAD domain-containing protein n=1 Tax=Actinophytocola sp. TaxID=1872138 RepID=UPI002DDD3A00|nr:CHAD domain-containing protein [Actinophytocola sp.]HEV2781921.1 CHAD domain-containing protein [Actinophytocola sp.]